MKLKVYNDDGSIKTHIITKDKFYKSDQKNKLGYICNDTKEQNLLDMIEAFYSDKKAVIYDKSNNQIKNCIDNLNINDMNLEDSKDSVLKQKDFNFVFFTSGSTGNSLGALKTKDNLLSEIDVLTKMLKKYNIKKVVVTVPFVHIYGTLFGFLYPLINDIDIHLKEHFLPHDLLSMIDDNTLVITTPLYVKALNSINEKKDLSKSLIISSTAPLEPLIAKQFNYKFSTNIMQIFGSTESGGIAYKMNDSEYWNPFEKVLIDTNIDGELKITSPFLSKVLYEKDFFQLEDNWLQTFDFVEIKNNSFKLIGRSSKIFKVAGKRYSTIEIENILEEDDSVQKALVFVKRDKDALKDEVLEIFIESEKDITTKEIKQILKKRLSNLKFSISLHVVGKIELSSVGKKIKPKKS